MFKLHPASACLIAALAFLGLHPGPTPALAAGPQGVCLHLGFESEDELLRDFVSQADRYARMGRESLTERKLAIEPGRFGNCLHIVDGSAFSKGTWNESGLDCDLIVAVMWGEWHKKPHYWGAGGFHGDRGTVAFWVKTDKLHPGIVFMQGSVAWGRKERDLFTVEVDKEGRLSAHIRDVLSKYHRVDASEATWADGEWQHIAVVYDRAYGLKLYQNGEIIASNWGQDAWWQTPFPGLFSPFLLESYYDEICFFDYPLTDEAVASLFRTNSAPPLPPDSEDSLDASARQRLLALYGDLDSLELPTVRAGRESLRMKQTEVKACHDEKIPAWWILDGRYELAWPHPYRLFTFVLGDVDFHGTKLDIDLAPGEKPNFIAVEGTIDDLNVLAGNGDTFNVDRPALAVEGYEPFFYSRKIETRGASTLRIPFVKEYGVPEDLEGSAHLPLSGKTRLHEVHLWQVETRKAAEGNRYGGRQWHLSPELSLGGFERYAGALQKLKSSGDRAVVASGPHPASASKLTLQPLQAVHLAGAGFQPDFALDTLGIDLLVRPSALTDYWWLKLRDPANPARIWAQTCLRVEFPEADTPQAVSVVMDIIDLMVASEDRVLVELTSAEGCDLIFGDAQHPATLAAFPAKNREKALQTYVKHEMLPAWMQYMKEYNYRPWRFTGEKVSLLSWDVFGGSYDMAYPVLAVLRHDPGNARANLYRTLVFKRQWFGMIEDNDVRRPMVLNTPENAPAWAVWERELYRLNREVTHWIAAQQRKDGMFWGGPNDDPFILLGWPNMPLAGDEVTRKAWLAFYEGLEALGIFHDGYCDIWPIDPLHITDFIGSRGLTLAFGLGEPHVVERELRTTERYHELVSATNARRAAEGLPPLSGDRAMRNKEQATLIEQMEAEVLEYSHTHVAWYWGATPQPPAHEICERARLAGRLMDLVERTDDAAVFGFTEARVHTDNQRGIGRDELVAAMLGGRVQGRAEPYPIGIAVSWEGIETEDLARLVSYADEKSLLVNLYNFRERPIEATMRLWRLAKGRYRVTIGSDDNDDGVIESLFKVAFTPQNPDTLELGRFARLPITAPPRKNIAIKIEQIEPLPEPEMLPDLAVSARDVHRKADDTIEVTVHNIGPAPAKDVQVDIVDAGGRVLASRTIAKMGSPSEDFAARRETVIFDGLGKGANLSVCLDRSQAIEEIFEENNQAAVPAL